jgi:hypothetical protein
MTVIVEPPTDTRPTPVFTGGSRYLAAALVTVGAALQVAEFVLEPAGQDTTSARLAWWADHSTRLEWSQAAGLVAIPFLIGGFAVMVALTRRFSRKLAAVAAVALTMAMTGLAAIHGVELAARIAAQSGSANAAHAILEGTGMGVPGIALFVMFLGGALIGTVTIYTAMWRSPLVPRLAVAFGVAFVVLDLFLGMGVAGHVAALASGLVLAWAVVTGYARSPRSQVERGAH